MKKVTFLAMALMCGVAFTNCAAKKNVAKQTESVQTTEQNSREKELEQLIKEKELEMKLAEIEAQAAIAKIKAQNAVAAETAGGVEVQIPCVEQSFDDKDYFRDLGIGDVSSNNEQSARAAAVNAAKSMIKSRLGEFIQGCVSDYFNDYAGSQPSDDVQRKTEHKLNGVVEKMLNDADKECEKRYVDARGNIKYYYVVKISKGDMKKEMMKALSASEKENIDFNEYKMQKFMDERMNDMLEAKAKAGY